MQLYDPCMPCLVPDHPTLDEAGCDNTFRCLKSTCVYVCLAVGGSWLSAVSLALLYQ